MKGMRIMSERFNEASRALSDRLYKAVYKLPNELKAKVQEIRVRAEKPLEFSCGKYGGYCYYISEYLLLFCL